MSNFFFFWGGGGLLEILANRTYLFFSEKENHPSFSQIQLCMYIPFSYQHFNSFVLQNRTLDLNWKTTFLYVLYVKWINCIGGKLSKNIILAFFLARIFNLIYFFYQYTRNLNSLLAKTIVSSQAKIQNFTLAKNSAFTVS